MSSTLARMVKQVMETKSAFLRLSPLLLFFNTLLFRALLGSQKIKGRYRDFQYIPHTHTSAASPIINIPTIGVHLLQWMNLR